MEKSLRIKNGCIIPEDRIKVYEKLLEVLPEEEAIRGHAFMCDLIEERFNIEVDLNTFSDRPAKGVKLPELRKFRPKTIEERYSAWGHARDFGLRVHAVEGAIRVWKKKFAK